MTTINLYDDMRAKLRILRLSTFADIFFDLVAADDTNNALAEEIFLKAVEETASKRRQTNIAKAITQTKFRYPGATLTELINPNKRGLNLRQLNRLAATPWRDEPSNVHVLAPTGAGKTYIACVIGIAACQAEYSVAYYRLDQLVDELAAFSPANERYVAKMRKLQNVDVLLLDDFLMIGINQRGQEDLTKIIFDRDGRLPTIIVSQTTAAYWVKKLPDPVGADSLVSRVHAGQRIELHDYDMRQHLASTTHSPNEKSIGIEAGQLASTRPAARPTT